MSSVPLMQNLSVFCLSPLFISFRKIYPNWSLPSSFFCFFYPEFLSLFSFFPPPNIPFFLFSSLFFKPFSFIRSLSCYICYGCVYNINHKVRPPFAGFRACAVCVLVYVWMEKFRVYPLPIVHRSNRIKISV